MKKLLSLLLAALLVVAPVTARAEEGGDADAENEGIALHTELDEETTVGEPAAVPITLPFEDVRENHWFYGNVLACYEDGIMVGTSETRFSPDDILREEETATLAARLLARKRGETLPAPESGETWYAPILRYLSHLNLGITPGVQCTRGRFLVMLGAVLGDEELESIRQVDTLPDSANENVLRFYRAGILSGKDAYGTFQPYGTLLRAEAAAMVSRILRPELRGAEPLADYAPFRAAGVAPSTPFFTNGVTAEQYLDKVNELITFLENFCANNGTEFNWHNRYISSTEMSFLDYVTETALADLGVTRSMGTQAYGTFNVQVYYSRLIDQRGGEPLGAAG